MVTEVSLVWVVKIPLNYNCICDVTAFLCLAHLLTCCFLLIVDFFLEELVQEDQHCVVLVQWKMECLDRKQQVHFFEHRHLEGSTMQKEQSVECSVGSRHILEITKFLALFSPLYHYVKEQQY